jgi:hypothetical protein
MSDGSRDEAAHRLAATHYEVEPGMRVIYRVMGPGEDRNGRDEPIKLLEVNEDTVPAGVQPLYFTALPASGIHYPSVIIEVTPEEFEQIKKGELPLPDGWRIDEALERPTAVGDR